MSCVWRYGPGLRLTDARHDSALSFLPDNHSTGFSLPYPLLALHAVSSTVPDSVASSIATATTTTQCVYCQIDDEAAVEEDADDGEEFGLRELWLVPASNDDGEQVRHDRTSF